MFLLTRVLVGDIKCLMTFILTGIKLFVMTFAWYVLRVVWNNDCFNRKYHLLVIWFVLIGDMSFFVINFVITKVKPLCNNVLSRQSVLRFKISVCDAGDWRHGTYLSHKTTSSIVTSSIKTISTRAEKDCFTPVKWTIPFCIRTVTAKIISKFRRHSTDITINVATTHYLITGQSHTHSSANNIPKPLSQASWSAYIILHAPHILNVKHVTWFIIFMASPDLTILPLFSSSSIALRTDWL